MASVEDFKYAMVLWKELELPKTINRELHIDLKADKIITIAGVRRSGKTSIMFQCMDGLMAQRVKKDNIIYVNFENERLVATKATDLDNLLVAHSQVFDPDGSKVIYLFLDEIQNVENWDKWIRKIYDTKRYRIIVTGSSSELLSREIATALAGRNLSYIVYPFSFAEFLKAKQLEPEMAELRYSSKRGAVLKAVDEFMEFGSFPEVALTNDRSRKIELLSTYFDAIFFRDLIKRYNLRETGALNVFLKVLAGNYASYFSSVKTCNYFGSIGLKISRITLLNFLEYSKAVFFAETLEQYLKSPRKRLARQVKSYIVDLGLSRLFADIDKGRALENCVFLELLRMRRGAESVHYLKLKSGKEVDFLVRGDSSELIQVSYDISNPETKKREFDAIVEAAESLGLKSGTIITYDYEKSEMIDGIKIKCVPFWLWALGDHNQ